MNFDIEQNVTRGKKALILQISEMHLIYIFTTIGDVCK